MNGSGKLVYWIMGAMAGIIMLFGSVGLSANRADISDLREKYETRTEAIYELRNEISSLRLELQSTKHDICRVESKVDDIRERQGQRVYRVPCP